MDPFQFALEASRAGVGYTVPFFPGNALPQGMTPSFPDSRKSVPVGIQNNEASWLSFMREVAYPVLTKTVVHSAWEEVTGSARRGKNLLKQVEENAVAAATGIANWTKWVVIGLAIVLVLYVASFIGRSL